jgi:hypothetical protein
VRQGNELVEADDRIRDGDHGTARPEHVLVSAQIAGCAASLRPVVEKLQVSGDFRRVLEQVRQFVDDHERSPGGPVRHVQRAGQHVAPVVQAERARMNPRVRGHRLSEPAQCRYASLLLNRGQHQAPGLPRKRPEQE